MILTCLFSVTGESNVDMGHFFVCPRRACDQLASYGGMDKWTDTTLAQGMCIYVYMYSNFLGFQILFDQMESEFCQTAATEGRHVASARQELSRFTSLCGSLSPRTHTHTEVCTY